MRSYFPLRMYHAIFANQEGVLYLPNGLRRERSTTDRNPLQTVPIREQSQRSTRIIPDTEARHVPTYRSQERAALEGDDDASLDNAASGTNSSESKQGEVDQASRIIKDYRGPIKLKEMLRQVPVGIQCKIKSIMT
ncbi:hypothetical protein ACLKA6_001073 [Drosophila palustris]